MTKGKALQKLYAIVEKVIPEPGIRKDNVMPLLRAASEFNEGVIGYLAQGTALLTRDLFTTRYTFHASINDYEFQQRLLAALQLPSDSE